MKRQRIFALIMCICMVIGFVPFFSIKTEAATSLPKDINGNEWQESRFATYYNNENTKYSGKKRIILSYDAFSSYGSKLKDGKYPLAEVLSYFGGYSIGKDNNGDTYEYYKVSIDKYDDTWTMEYYDTTSNADRYKICLSDGKTYLKDNTGSLPTSGGDLTVTTDKSSATAWDLKFVEYYNGDGSPLFSFGHDISNADPHFYVNLGDTSAYLDLSRKTTSLFDVMVEMPWLQTKFCYEDGSEYKQDTRQVGSFTVPEGPVKTGYTFLGWTDTKGGTKVVYKAGDTITPISSKSYYPVYSVNNYTVRFYADNTLSGGYVEQSFTYDRAQKLTKNTFTSAVADFAGWANADNPTKTYVDCENVSNLTTAANGIVKLYALWNEISYTVNFSANYGVGSAPSQKVKYSDEIALPDSSSFTRDGYELIGWNTKPDGTGEGFAIGQTASKLTTKSDDIVTLYAIWEKNGSAHTHIAGEWETVRYATCTENGERVKKCTDCNTVMETGEISALGHKKGSSSIINKEATCNGAGERVWYCERCNTPIETEVIDAKGHTEGKAVTKLMPTCTTEGVKEISCEDCGAVLREEKIDALGHSSAGDYITEKSATCTETGIKVKKCERCQFVIEEAVIPKTEHNPGTWLTIKGSTCTANGLKVKKCTDCGVVLEQETIKSSGHHSEVWITRTEPTCVSEGERVCRCDACGFVYKTERIAALGHTPGNAETCVDDQVCLTCGTVLEKADGRSHTWSDWKTSKKASYFSERKDTRFCTSCNKSEFRYVRGTAGCHKSFPHKGDGSSCGACQVLYNVNMFFRRADKFLFGWIRDIIGF